MVVIMYNVFSIFIVAFLLNGKIEPNNHILQEVFDKLDVTSFSNSIGPRREKDKKTFSDYGAFIVKIDNKKLFISGENYTWKYTITLLDKTNDGIKVCFEDRANNGGTYASQEALLLKFSENNFLQASKIIHPKCEFFAK